jgi:NAD(P)-dependent dehydrogenase (short-subunit alcohol dehydrogenase family)
MERYVLVTGGSRGIGRAIVLRFSEPGVRVALTYRSRNLYSPFFWLLFHLNQKF